MSGAEVLRVLDALDGSGIGAGITGGWGIDALLGRQTRVHADLDLGIATEAVADAIEALGRAGYRVSLDERPARVVLEGEAGRGDLGRVDIHPIAWTPAGGVQRGPPGEVFEYPPGSLDAEGVIAGRTVRCGTPDLQLAFHAHYEPRDHDRRDMAALADTFGLSLPPAYRDRSTEPKRR